MKMPRPPSLLFALLFACFVDGCDSSSHCVDVGCLDAFVIHFEAASWEQGKYTIETVADGKAGTCEVNLPLGTWQQSTCGILILSMKTVPSGQPGLADLEIIGQPARVDVTVKRDGVVLGQPASFTPVYATKSFSCTSCKVAEDRMKL